MSTRSTDLSGSLKFLAVVLAGLAFATPHIMITAFYGWMFIRADVSNWLTVLGLGG